MRQDTLKSFISRQPGWNVVASYKRSMKRYGIGLDTKYKNGWGLSFVAGEGVYSSPQKKVRNYTSVEVALISPRNKVIRGHGNRKYFEYGVEGWSNLNKIKKLMKYVEKMRWNKWGN